MRTNIRTPKLIHQKYAPYLPKTHRMSSSIATRMTAQLYNETAKALRDLERRGVVGADEREEVMKELEGLVKKMYDINKREQLVVKDRVEQEFADELEEQSLNEITADPNRTRWVPNFTLRQRLRSCSENVLDFVDTAVEALKRLRYSNYIAEEDYDRYRGMVESLPELRTELIDLMEKAGD